MLANKQRHGRLRREFEQGLGDGGDLLRSCLPVGKVRQGEVAVRGARHLRDDVDEAIVGGGFQATEQLRHCGIGAEEMAAKEARPALDDPALGIDQDLCGVGTDAVDACCCVRIVEQDGEGKSTTPAFDGGFQSFVQLGEGLHRGVVEGEDLEFIAAILELVVELHESRQTAVSAGASPIAPEFDV